MALNFRLLALAKQHVSSRLNFHTTCVTAIHRKWKAERGLPRNPNKEGPLTDLPDYTFMDGRPTPLGVRQRSRVLKQRELAQKLVTAIDELDFAKDRFARIKKEEKDAKQAIIDSKLKPKGRELLK